MGSVPTCGTRMIYIIISYMCATGRLHLEVFKHLGLANFDDNRSEELKRFYNLSLISLAEPGSRTLFV